MKRTRQIHLWIGLVCSVFILVQAVTGLLLMEPWLIGGGKEGVPGQRGQMGGEGGGNVGFIKNLHAGKIGNTDIGWLIDLGAIGLIILTVTGITMSIKILKAQRIRRGKIKAQLQG